MESEFLKKKRITVVSDVIGYFQDELNKLSLFLHLKSVSITFTIRQYVMFFT